MARKRGELFLRTFRSSDLSAAGTGPVIRVLRSHNDMVSASTSD